MKIVTADRVRRESIELPREAAPPELYPIADAPRFRGLNASSKENAARDKVRKIIAMSRKRWKTAEAATHKLRINMREDQRMDAGDQWRAEDFQARNDEGRPCLTINRIPQFIRQVSNQNRANRSSITVHARGKGATTKLANAFQAVIRTIETESDADVAYDTATQHQLVSGLGFVRLMAEWQGDEGFEQACRLRRVRNPLAVYWDPSTQEADFADMWWAHVVAVVGKDYYNERWGQLSPYMSMVEFLGLGNDRMDDWAPEGKVFLAEYYWVEIEDRELLMLSTGQSIWATDWEDFIEMWAYTHPGEPEPQVVRTRVVKKRIVKWCLHNAVDILEGNEDRTDGREVPGDRIPIFPVIGDERDLDGEVDYRGMVRDARDPQRMYNFWSSSIAEAVALAPKAPWVAAKGQIENYLTDWQQANRTPKAVLFYDPMANGDTLVPPPQRNVVDPAIGAMVQGLAESNQDLMSVMGLFEPSLGQRGSRSESGKARELLQNQGVIANSNFLDNLQRTKRSIGRALLKWIPVVYDVPRIIHLVQPDGKKQPAVIYAGEENKPQEGEFADVSDMYDMSVGHFDIAVSTGPSYQTEKQATQAWLLDLFKVLPGLAEMGADIVLEQSDNEAAQQLAKRAKMALPPQFQDESDPAGRAAMLQAENAQLKKLVELGQNAIGQMAKVLEGKELDNDTKKEVAMIQVQGQLAKAQAEIGSAQSIAAFQAEATRFAQLVDQIHAETVIDMQNDHASVMEAQRHAQTVQQIGAKRDADAALAEQQAELNPPPTETAGGEGGGNA